LQYFAPPAEASSKCLQLKLVNKQLYIFS